MLATLYAACADPPKKPNRGGAGAAGTAGETVGEAGMSEEGGRPSTAGTGGTGGKGSEEAGMGGELAAEGGMGGEAGEAGSNGGTGGALPEACTGLTIGKSNMPAPPTTNVAKPNGAVGGLKVINWAGFKGAISYTFDDSLQSQTTHYEALNAVGIHVTFYLNNFNQGSNPIWEKAVADGHELGNHTVHHCHADGSGCVNGTFTTVDKELDDNTAFLMAKKGVTGVYTFATPFGDNNWTDAASQRFLAARSVSDSNGGITPTGNFSAFTLPCHVANEGETAATGPNGGFNKLSDDVRTAGSWRTILMHNIDPDITDYGFNPVKLEEAVAAMTYTKSLGDVWADTVVAVASYWQGQKALAGVQPKTVGSDKVYSWTLPAHFPPGMYLRATVTGGKVKQCGTELTWDEHGYYEINLDAGSLTISP